MQPGDLNRKLAFQGKGRDRWDLVCNLWAHVRYLRGSERVIQGRLQGSNTTIVTVARHGFSEQVKTPWRIRDARTGEVFNIRSIIFSEDGGFIEFTCETGEAS